MIENLEDSKTWGLLVRRARKVQGLTQADLAGLCNTGRRFIIDLENGKPRCQLGLALKVARILGLKILVEGPDA